MEPKRRQNPILKAMYYKKQGRAFFERDVLEVAPDLLGAKLVRVFDNGAMAKYKITEVEAYRGEDDLACHASKGRTKRTEVMYLEGGLIYVYFIYGMYWMLNVVTGKRDAPQAVLIRGLEAINGPGRVAKKLRIDKSFYGEDLTSSPRMWIEVNDEKKEYFTDKRVGIDYAGEHWKNMSWRYILTPTSY